MSFKEFLKNHKNNSDNTIYQNFGTVKQFIDQSKNVVTVETIQKFLNKYKNKNVYFIRIKKYCDYLLLIDESFQREYNQIRMLKLKDKKIKRTRIVEDGTEIELPYKFAIPQEKWNECYDQLPYMTQRIGIWIGFNFGLRLSEIINLEWRDINFKSQIMKVRGTKTANADRKIYMTDDQSKVLSDYKEKVKELNSVNVVFTINKYEKERFIKISKRTFTNWVNKIRIIMEIDGYKQVRKCRAHVLRYSFATNFYEKTGVEGLFMLSKILGHQDIKTTSLYLTLSEENISTNMRQALEEANL